VLPLYPQYAAPTTASVMDAVFAHCARLRWVPELRFINDYHANPRYIAALADSVREYWAAHGRPERLLLSFHGLPQNISWPAIRISASARRPHACCAKPWHSTAKP
jgi:ferrochelatase